MFQKLGYYIVFDYFKYILFSLVIFLFLIWLSQILRILDLNFSISNQIFEVVHGTIYVLPSFINPLLPFIIVLGSIALNMKLNSSNEIFIIRQYFSLKKNIFIFFITALFTLIIYFLNNEIYSVETYNKYKIKELEIRNNLQLGYAENNEMHIENLVSLFFQKKIKDEFYNIEAIIYSENQFIKSESAEIEFSKNNFNLIFYNGERITLNSKEKSKTKFEKFIFSLKTKQTDNLTFDKEHFNTIELLKSENKSFVNYGHNRIYQYFLLVLVLIISNKIIFFDSKNNLPIKIYIIFIVLFFSQLINSYLMYLLNLFDSDYYKIYYLINFIVLTNFYIISLKLTKQ